MHYETGPEDTDAFDPLNTDVYADTGELQVRLFPKPKQVESAQAESASMAKAEPVDFSENALALVQRGFSVNLLRPRSKEPIVGACERTRDTNVIARWAAQYSDANVGLCADENFVILESDNETEFRRIVKEIGKQELPPTLTSGARPNRPHWIYKRGAVPVGLNLTVHGLFELRAHNQYIVGPGSVHPEGQLYKISRDREPAIFPKWLLYVLQTMHGAKEGRTNAASAFIAPDAVAEIKRTVSDAPYYGDIAAMLDDPTVDIFIPDGSRNNTLVSVAGLLYTNEWKLVPDEEEKIIGAELVAREEEEVFDLLCEIRDRFCEAPGDISDEALEKMVANAMKGKPCDWPDFAPCFGDIDAVTGHLVAYASQEVYDSRPHPSPESRLVKVDWFFDGDSFLQEELPPRLVLAEELNGTPVFYEKSLNQVFAFRGLGKTMFVHGLVDIFIHGGEFLRYKSNGGMRVLLADGELPDVQLQDRVSRLIGESDGLLKLMSPERMPGNTFPNLSERTWQVEFMKRIAVWKPDVVVFDTLTGCFKFDTNDADTWREVNGFLIELRILGLCVILVHHAGKAGTQRGRTDGDDNLDLSVKLEAPKGWAAGDGLEVAVSYEKVRAGGRLSEFSAAYRDGGWELTENETSRQALGMLLNGKSSRAIANALDINQSAVIRIKRQAEKSGVLFPQVKSGRRGSA